MAFKWLSNKMNDKPKEKYSLEQLQYVVRELEKHPEVNETNKDEVVEHLRMMAELIIWGDQNNSSVLDYCLESNVLQFFLKYMAVTGKDVQTQLLQTLSIMLQNL